MQNARSLVLSAGRFLATFSAVVCLFGDSAMPRLHAQAPAPAATAELVVAPALDFAGEVDSNSPAIWDLVDGRPTLHVLNSVAGKAELSQGRNLGRLMTVDEVEFTTAAPLGGFWMEAVVEDANGTWYGYYHNEVKSDACPDTDKVQPRIGAARSYDRGRTWEDLGPVLEMPSKLAHCETNNQYFVGGVGDLSMMLDADKQYLYMFYSQYVERDGDVGVAVARMPWANRDSPAGAMTVFNKGAWLPAQFVATDGGGSWNYDVASPVYGASHRWDDGSDTVDAFWGPSVHWNTYLNSYVMLLNRAVSNGFDPGGIYVAYLPDLSNPKTWSMPVQLINGGEWYPQVVGLAPGAGTDKLAGETARFYMKGRSQFFIRFGKP